MKVIERVWEMQGESEKDRKLARYDEAIAMLRKGRSLDGWTFADEVKVDEFLSQEPGE